jgi:hypothetical protein
MFVRHSGFGQIEEEYTPEEINKLIELGKQAELAMQGGMGLTADQIQALQALVEKVHV